MPERSLNCGGTAGGCPVKPGRKVTADSELAGTCAHCCAYRAFLRHGPSIIEASDRVEYAVHLVVRHGFVR